VALLEILGQSMIKSLKFQTIFLGFFKWGLGSQILLLFLHFFIFLLWILILLLCILSWFRFFDFLLFVAFDHGRLKLIMIGLLHLGIWLIFFLSLDIHLDLLGLRCLFSLLRFLWGRLGLLFSFLFNRLNRIFLGFLMLLGVLLELLVGDSHLLWIRTLDLSTCCLRCKLLLLFELLFLLFLFFTFLTLSFLRLFGENFLTLLMLLWLAVSALIRGVLANVINFVFDVDVAPVLVGVPSVLALTDETSIFVIHAVVASIGGIASTTLTEVSNASDSEHALIGCVELFTEHALDIVLQGHAIFALFHLLGGSVWLGALMV
jgi:hypothetical protein